MKTVQSRSVALVAGVVILTAALGASQVVAAVPKAAPPPAAAPVATGPKTANDYVERGLSSLNANRVNEAIVDFDTAAKLDPKYSVAVSLRGYARVLAGQVDRGVADFDAALKLNPKDTIALCSWAEIHGDRQEWPQAIDKLTRALEIDPTIVRSRLLRAVAYMVQGEKDKALGDALVLQTQMPDSPTVPALLAGIYGEMGDTTKQAQTLRDSVAKFPDNADLHVSLAQVLRDCKGQTRETCTAWRTESLTVYDKAIALAPSAELYVDRAQARPQSDRDAKFADLTAAVELEPGSEYAILTRGATWLNYGEYDKALADLNAAIVLDPADGEAYRVRATLQSRRGQYDEHVRDLDMAISLDSENFEYLNTTCWARATHKRELSKALEHCNAALKLQPDSVAALDSRGLVYLQMGNWQAALDDYNAALQGVSNPTSLYGRGIAEMHLDMKKAGKADLEAARKARPKIEKTFAGYGLKP